MLLRPLVHEALAGQVWQVPCSGRQARLSEEGESPGHVLGQDFLQEAAPGPWAELLSRPAACFECDSAGDTRSAHACLSAG